MCLENEKTRLSIVQTELELSSGNLARALMRETAKLFDFTFYQGSKGMESFIMAISPQDKVGHAVVEIYDAFAENVWNNGFGHTRTLHSVQFQYQLTDKELEDFVIRIQLVRSSGFNIRMTGRRNQKLTERRIYKA